MDDLGNPHFRKPRPYIQIIPNISYASSKEGDMYLTQLAITFFSGISILLWQPIESTDETKIPSGKLT
jgi:hypothetical protein